MPCLLHIVNKEMFSWPYLETDGVALVVKCLSHESLNC